MARFTKKEMLERVAQALQYPELAEYQADRKRVKFTPSVAVQLIEAGDFLEEAAGWGLGIHVIHYGEPFAVLKPDDQLYATAKADLAKIAAVALADQVSQVDKRTDQIVHELDAVLRKRIAKP